MLSYTKIYVIYQYIKDTKIVCIFIVKYHYLRQLYQEYMIMYHFGHINRRGLRLSQLYNFCKST